jgi:glycosyltransferase involved in cell wall biosynthesis
VLSPIKGSDVLFGALEQLRGEMEFELIVVGSTEAKYLAELRRKFSPELWRRVQFKNHLTPEQVAAEMAAAALMIFPTRADTSPNSVKEAAVAGLPVVASAVGGIPDYIWPGRNGLLFPSGDVAACALAVRSACEHPLFGRGFVEPEALSAARDYLSPARMGQSFRGIYAELVRS